ncbi:DUF6077 domain-containing protein [Pseudomonas fluorescens]|uniref:Uncharacterized protein n=1 Tax=Pseudomonas fluorescens TaxID=294 RepID=A0A5E7BNA2_PSEFL|nr:DUF6077 domain-containing protein [Pseudomonas fluorescens]VVN93135.1 hypothetical protein PS710_02047 [Pseudomonas fluorescens]
MHKLLAFFLVFFAGWTLSSHIAVVFQFSLKNLLILAPFIIGTMFTAYNYLNRPDSNTISQNYGTHENSLENFKTSYAPVIFLFITCATLKFSWIIFCIMSSSFFIYLFFKNTTKNIETTKLGIIQQKTRSSFLLNLILIVSAITLTMAINRPDLDDAFYVAVSAFTSAHPDQPILTADPMFGDRFPLIFPSYKFASFEILEAAVAYIFDLPAMVVTYIIFPPVLALITVSSIILLSREYLPARWKLMSLLYFSLIIFLGETHRAPANMMFVRLFQGKAAYLSIIVPAIFYLTGQYFSHANKKPYIFLLCCIQIAAIGLTNFGMLAAPLAALGAIASNYPKFIFKKRREILSAISPLLIPIPYLLTVAMQYNTGHTVISSETETAHQVWTSVFGERQQFLVALLLLLGPLLATDRITRWRLSVPVFILLALYLNPFLSSIISKYVTTPPVYWRVVWSLPILAFAAAAITLLISRLKDEPTSLPLIAAASVIFYLIIYSADENSLRKENIGEIGKFAALKVDPTDLEVAKVAVQMSFGSCKILAPDDISGVISRFEIHPPLIGVRGIYLQMLADYIETPELEARQTAINFASSDALPSRENLQRALSSLDVGTIVIANQNASIEKNELLSRNNYIKKFNTGRYTIWSKPCSTYELFQ